MSNDCKISRWQILKGQLNNLTPEEFKEAVENSTASKVIDCRKPEEFTCNRLYNAVNLDYLGDGFPDRLENLDKEAAYFVYCRSGRRSLRTCILLKNSGFENVFNLDGGLNAWEVVFPGTDINA